MFEELFTHRAAIACYYATPLFEERLRYLIASSAAASSRSRKSTVRLVWRFAGMASTRWQCSSSAGSRMATKRKKLRIAALRTLRVRMLFLRSSSTKARNPATRSASMSATDRSVGCRARHGALRTLARCPRSPRRQRRLDRPGADLRTAVA